MATISARTEEGTYKITQWYGLDENPDGDTKLRLGAASVCQNWRITRDRNLQRRPGNSMIKGLLTGYKKIVSDDVVILRVDTHKSSNLRMYPNAETDDAGFINVSGTPVSVSYETHEDYIGYYWKRGIYFTYELTSCVYDPVNDTYTWYGRQVTSNPDTKDSNHKVQGIWSGIIGGVEHVIAACDGHLWKLWDEDTQEWVKQDLGRIDTKNRVTFFPFSGIVYILNGVDYMQFDGTSLTQVVGYRPLISISNVAAGGGELLEEVNKLNGLRRLWFSPDGTATTFQLPETDLISIDYVMINATGEYMSPDLYSVDPYDGTVTFDTAPTSGTNTIEIGYTAPSTSRYEVTNMTNAELFSGATDTRVFIYGDGSNEALFSDIDYFGQPRADYFPDLNEMAVGDSNTPITAMIRHYSRLIVYKSNSTWNVQASTMTLDDGNLKATFYVIPVNKSIGNAALGQVRLVLNSPYALFGNDLYEWKSNSSYSSNLTLDERQARRISDRIYSTLSTFDSPNCYCYDDNDNQEYYICYDGKALVYNYAVDAWYVYTDFDVNCATNFAGFFIFGTKDGKVECLSYKYKTNDGKSLDSYWESGSIDFGRPYQRKYSAEMWVGIKPESSGNVTVTVQTDKKSEYTEKVVSSDLFDFGHVNFNRFAFSTNRKPQIKKLKIKAKKFVYYKLIFKTNGEDTAATILNTDIRVRFTGYAK